MVTDVPQDSLEHSYAMLWLASYTFLLRLPSEVRLRTLLHPLRRSNAASLCKALPMCKANPDSALAAQEQTIIWENNGEVHIRIARRKNRPKGSGIIRRRCTCKVGESAMCTVHALWEGFFARLPDGAKPWARITANRALELLRMTLRRLQIPAEMTYGTHDFRRGHAEVIPHLD